MFVASTAGTRRALYRFCFPPLHSPLKESCRRITTVHDTINSPHPGEAESSSFALDSNPIFRSVPPFVEPYSSEYEEGSSVRRKAQARNASSATVLSRLILKGDFDGAQIARDELLALETDIEPDTTFVQAALNTLSIKDAQTRSKAFFAWWSFVPLTCYRSVLPELSSNLLQHPFDLGFIMEVCLSYVRAGMCKSIASSELIRHVFRYGRPSIIRMFLKEIEKAEQSRPAGSNMNTLGVLINSAVRSANSSGRTELARELMEEYSSQIKITSGTLESVKRTEFPDLQESLPPTPQTRYGHGRKATTGEVASQLRALRRIAMSANPPNFDTFLADFMFTYTCVHQRSRGFLILRRRVFRKGKLRARAIWVAGEQLFYSSRRRPLANLRTFHRHCVMDPFIAQEIERVLNKWEPLQSYEKRHKDWKLSRQDDTGNTKIWPRKSSLKFAWKAILQLSHKDDLERLYTLLLKQVEEANSESELESLVSTPPSSVPDSVHFHHFIVAFATRISPRRGSEVIADMRRMGFAPSLDDWGSLAGAYARSGDVERTMRILDHVDEFVKGESKGSQAYEADRASREGELAATSEAACKSEPVAILDTPTNQVSADDVDQSSSSGKNHRNAGSEKRVATQRRQKLVALYYSVIRGFSECRMYSEAREVQARMQEHGFLDGGPDKRGKAVLHRLSRYEKGHFAWQLQKGKYKRRKVAVDGRLIYIDPRRVDWLVEREAKEVAATKPV